MTCDEARALFTDLADGRLGAAERDAVGAHLATCAECRREWEGFERTLQLLHGLPRYRAPAGFPERVLSAARPAPWPRRLARRLFVPLHVKLPVEAAAIALIAVGASLMTRAPEVRQAMPGTPPAHEAPARVAAPAPESGPAPPVGAPAAKKAASGRRDAVESRAGGKPSEPGKPETVHGAADTARRPRQPAPAASGLAAPGPVVSGRLAVNEPARAEHALAALFARTGATEVSRVQAPDGLVVEVDVPRAQYMELVRGLASIGAWTPEGEPETNAAGVRVSVRIRPPGVR